MARRKKSKGGFLSDGTKLFTDFTVETRMRCLECRKTTSMFRHKKDKKARGHRKHMHCYNCVRTTPHEQT